MTIRPLAESEKEQILEAILATGSMKKAAMVLGTSRMTLYRKLRHYGIALKASKILDEVRRQRLLRLKNM